jgi:hypothetical protein
LTASEDFYRWCLDCGKKRKREFYKTHRENGAVKYSNRCKKHYRLYQNAQKEKRRVAAVRQYLDDKRRELEQAAFMGSALREGDSLGLSELRL